MSQTIAKILKQHFDKKKKDFSGLSTRWLGKRLSISQVYVSQIFSGKRSLPGGLLHQICDLLDIDAEKKEILSNEILKAQGWAKIPSKKLRETALDTKAHALDWSSAPLSDLPLLTDYKTLLVLDATQLVDFDGSTESLAHRLGLSIEEVEIRLKALKEAGYLETKKGKLHKSRSLMELQSKAEKRDVVRFHKSAMDLAKKTMDEKTTEFDLEQRLITTSLFTCSHEHVPLLRAKLAEFIKEVTADAADQEAEEIYQFGIAFFPLSKRS